MKPHTFVSVDQFNEKIEQYETIFWSKDMMYSLLKTKEKEGQFALLDVVVGDTDTLENARYEILNALEGFAKNVEHYRMKYILQDIHKIAAPVPSSIDTEKFVAILQKRKLDEIAEAIFCSVESTGNLSFIPRFLAKIIIDEKRDDEIRTYLINDYPHKPENENRPEDNAYYKAAKDILNN